MSEARKAILPGATLGVMGGGQLGRMFVHAAQSLGYRTAVLDPDAASPAGLVSHHHIHADYLDADGLGRLVTLADIVERQMASRTTQVSVLVAFAGVALLLALVGIHSRGSVRWRLRLMVRRRARRASTALALRKAPAAAWRATVEAGSRSGARLQRGAFGLIGLS